MNPPGEESGVPHGCCAWSPGTVQPRESWPFQQLLIRVRYTGCGQITWQVCDQPESRLQGPAQSSWPCRPFLRDAGL